MQWNENSFLGLLQRVRTDCETRVGRERRARRALQREVAKLREYCMTQECEMQMYRMMMQQHQERASADEPPPPPLPPPTHTL